jgi:REP element-mobilizing transposase RayT
MPSRPRKELVDPSQIGVYHCTSRCVRRAFLCGFDEVTKRKFDHRKEWIVDRLQLLASITAIEVCDYAIMNNHYHVILRTRPDIARNWSDEDVARRWILLRRSGRDVHFVYTDGIEVDEAEIKMITADPAKVAEYRRRLMSISSFMAQINEPVARAANREDKLKGRFWESRFHSQQLLDDAALLACSIYVDLNPIRAKVAQSPEEAKYTSAYDRIRAILADAESSNPVQPAVDAIDVPKSLIDSDIITCIESASVETIRVDDSLPAEGNSPKSSVPRSSKPVKSPDAWLCKLTFDEGSNVSLDDGLAISATKVIPDDPTVVVPEKIRIKPPVRASNRGMLPITIDKYLSLLDWTGRSIREGSKGSIPADLAPILERLGLNGEHWVDTIKNFGKMFKRASGRPISLTEAAKRSGQLWFQGASSSRVAFI